MLATTWLVFKHVGYGHKGINHVRDTSLYIKILPISYLLLLKNKFVSLSQEQAQGRGKRMRFQKSTRTWQPPLQISPVHSQGKRPELHLVVLLHFWCVHINVLPVVCATTERHTLSRTGTFQSHTEIEKSELFPLHSSLLADKTSSPVK